MTPGWWIFTGIAGANVLNGMLVWFNRWALPRRWWDTAGQKGRSRWLRFRYKLAASGWGPAFVVPAITAWILLMAALGMGNGSYGG